jgi:hypothetical protein
MSRPDLVLGQEDDVLILGASMFVPFQQAKATLQIEGHGAPGCQYAAPIRHAVVRDNGLFLMWGQPRMRADVEFHARRPFDVLFARRRGGRAKLRPAQPSQDEILEPGLPDVLCQRKPSKTRACGSRSRRRGCGVVND